MCIYYLLISVPWYIGYSKEAATEFSIFFFRKKNIISQGIGTWVLPITSTIASLLLPPSRVRFYTSLFQRALIFLTAALY